MRTRIVVLALVLACSPAVRAAVPDYPVIQLQARSNIVDGFNLPANSSFNSKTPELNDDAVIAFTLIVVGGAPVPGLFVGSGGSGTVVYTGPADRALSDPSINESGFVAFNQSDIFSEGVFVYDPGAGSATQAIPPTFAFAAAPTITDGGKIGFRSGILGGDQSWVIFDAGTTATYATETGNIAFLFTPSTNNLDEIAGKVRLNNTNNDAPDEIRVYDGPGSFTVVASDVDADALSPYSGFDNSPALADDGRVAFIASLVGGGRGVFLTDGTTTTTIATTADPGVADISFFSPSVNASGLVAFRGTDGAGLDAVFAGDGTELVRVIGEHDLVETDLGTARIDQNDGSVTFGGGLGLNERGDLAFNASLTPPDNNQIEWGSGMFVALVTPPPPPPVPDGNTVGGSPLRVGKHSSGALILRWDASTCPGDDTNLFAGDLGAVSSLTLSSEECGLGTSGAALYTPPPGDAFFVLATETADGTESGHGFDGAGVPRSSNGVGLCGIVAQSLDGTCP